MPVHHKIIIDRVSTTAEILADWTSSYWLRQALQASRSQDPIDALHDAEVLVMILAARVHALTT